MRPPDVVAVLEDLGLPVRSGLAGFDLGVRYEGKLPPCTVERWRVCRGGGVAGRGEYWNLIEIHGKGSTKFVSTKRELKRLLLEWQAGDRPLDREGYETFASRDATGRVAWQQRRKK